MKSEFEFAEEDGRKWLGKTVLLPDKERGGVTSKTFLNVTFGKCKKKPTTSQARRYNNKWSRHTQCITYLNSRTWISRPCVHSLKIVYSNTANLLLCIANHLCEFAWMWLYGMFYMHLYMYLNTDGLIVGTSDLSYIYIIIIVLRKWIEKSRFSKYHVMNSKPSLICFEKMKIFV